MTFAEKIKHVRGRLYLSQKSLAKELGVSFATINRWENGHLPTFLLECKFNDYCKKNSITFEEKN